MQEIGFGRKRRGQSLQKTQTDIAIVQRRGSDIAENAGSYGHQRQREGGGEKMRSRMRIYRSSPNLTGERKGDRERDLLKIT